MSENLTIAMGAISPPIAKQIEDAGLLVPTDCPAFQRAADSLTYLKIQGYITDSMAHSARKKLTKDIGKAVSAANQMDGES